jgi:glycerophosphoryl diester phosphodiesterase
MKSSTLFIVVACLSAFHAQSVRANPADAADEVRQIVAHRGASAERPECTMAALRRAIETGATAVEVDVRTSRDGQLFLLHDATLDRTTNGKGAAREKSLAELKKLDAGSWFDGKYAGERIPTLREARVVKILNRPLLAVIPSRNVRWDRKISADTGWPEMSKDVEGIRCRQ